MAIYGNRLQRPVEFFDFKKYYIFETEYISEAVINKNKLGEAIERLKNILKDLLYKIKTFIKNSLKFVKDKYYNEVNKNKPKVKGYYEFYHKYFTDVNDLFRLDTNYLKNINNDNVEEYAEKIENLFVNRIEKRFKTTGLLEIQNMYDEFVKEEKYILNYNKNDIKKQSEKIDTLIKGLQDDINILNGILQNSDFNENKTKYIQKIIFKYTHLIQFAHFGMRILFEANKEFDRVMKEYKMQQYRDELKEEKLNEKISVSFIDSINKKDVKEIRAYLIFLLRRYIDYPGHKKILAKFNASLSYALKYKIDIYEVHDDSIGYAETGTNTEDSLRKNIENLENNFSKERISFILKEISKMY